MTDDLPTPQTAPPPAQPLDGSEALLTAEWNVADLPWLTPDETLEPVAAPSSGTAMPLPPSQRHAPPTAFAADAAAPRPAAGTPTPLITRPKQRQPELQISPSVLVAPDFGATLPPRAKREAAACPSVERNAQLPIASRGRPSFVALGAALGCLVGYAVWTAVLRPAQADATPERGLPEFLRESAATTGVPSSAGVSTAAPGSTLPPSLAATLAQALPPAASEAASLAGDAGAPAAPPALVEDTNPPSPEPILAETYRRADALRAALDAERTHPRPATSESKPATRVPPVARRTTESKSSPFTGSTAPGVKSPRADSTPRSDARAPLARSSPVIRPLTTYTYEDKALFAIATAPMRVTDLVLERGETLVSQPTAGDAARWVISVVQGDAQSHVFVKPLRPGLRTNLTLTTTRRSYFLELSCRDDGTYMAGVAWKYPADEAARRREALAQAARERQSTTAVSDLQALRFDYRIDIIGGAPPWKPTMVFDDGAKTFIRFPRSIAAAQAPVLLIPRTGTTQDAKYVNYRIKGDLYVVDRLIDAAELRLASDDDGQDIVRITRTHLSGQ